MKTWLLTDTEDAPRDRWESREMPVEQAFLYARGELRVWAHREPDGTYEVAVGTEEEVTELWPRGAKLMERPKQEAST